MKKFLLNILYWMEINFFLSFFHFLTLLVLAFNDSGEHYDTIIESLPYLRIGLSFIIFPSICIVFLFRKKENFNIFQYLILQTAIIILWGLYYINNLVG